MSATDIYQRIYDADITLGSGLPAVVQGEATDEEAGYVTVTESFDASNVKDLLGKVVIPASKKKSYQLAEALFDNYDLISSVADDITQQEAAEVDILLDHIVNLGPMRIAREYIAIESGRSLSDAAWYALVKETWFRPFAVGSSPTRSGFEHVFMGEQARGNSIGGLHWWYFYLVKMDMIEYGGAIYGNTENDSGLFVPEIATMTFTWDVSGRSIVKKIGGFFVGLSVEGLMAMGMVRASTEAIAPNIAEIQGAEVELKLFKSSDRRSINTFYPVFRRVLVSTPRPNKPLTSVLTTTTDPPIDTGSSRAENVGALRLLSVVANPSGQDEGREKFTVLNVLERESLNLKRWKVVGPNGSFFVLGDVVLKAGEARTFTIPARGGLQLSNKGGNIKVLHPNGAVAQSVDYDRRLAGIQGAVLIWNGMSSLVQVPTLARTE